MAYALNMGRIFINFAHQYKLSGRKYCKSRKYIHAGINSVIPFDKKLCIHDLFTCPGNNKNTIFGEGECEFVDLGGEILKIIEGDGDTYGDEMPRSVSIFQRIMKNLLGYGFT